MRERVDGNRFQREVEQAAQKLEQPVFLVRLRTPQARQANVKNISDYILFGNITTILEVKETGAKSFSLNTFQQKEEVEKFQKFFDEANRYYDFRANRPYRAATLVHIMAEQKYVLYYMEDAPLVVMHPEDKNCMTFSTLKEAIQYLAVN